MYQHLLNLYSCPRRKDIQTEQIDDIIFGKLKDRETEIDKVHRELTKEIQSTERLLIEMKVQPLTSMRVDNRKKI